MQNRLQESRRNVSLTAKWFGLESKEHKAALLKVNNITQELAQYHADFYLHKDVLLPVTLTGSVLAACRISVNFFLVEQNVFYLSVKF